MSDEPKKEVPRFDWRDAFFFAGLVLVGGGFTAMGSPELAAVIVGAVLLYQSMRA